MSQYSRYPTIASGSWKAPVATAANLPATGNSPGDVRAVLDTDTLYVWNGSAWILLVAPGATPPGGSNTQVQFNNAGAFAGSAGLTYIVGTQALNVGGVLTASNFSGSSSGTNTGDVTLAAVGSSPSANAASLSGQVLTLQPFDSTHPGVVTASGGGTVNFLRADGSWATPPDTTGITQLTADVTAGPGSGSQAATVAKIQGTTVTGTTGTGNVVFSASPTLTGTLVAAAANFSGAISASNFSGSSSGSNTGDQTITLTGDVTGSGTSSFAATIANNAVTFAKIQNIATGVLLGRSTAATGNIETISVGSGLTLAGGTLSASGGSGSVTSVSVVSANGLAGTVATATTTPAITLSTTITGVLKGNGTAISAASAGTDYQAPISIGALDAQAANATGLALVSNVLSTQSADAAHPGMVNTTTQTFGGAKTFPAPLTITGSNTSALVINTSAFVFDSTNSALGINNATPATNTFIDAINSTGATKRVVLTGYGTGSFVGNRGRFARGTAGAPAAAQSGDVLSFISGQGYGATGFSATSTGVMNMAAGATFTDSSMPTYMTFSVTPSASVTAAEAVRINSTGAVLVATTTDDAASKLQVNGQTTLLNNNIIKIKQATYNGEVDNGNSGTSKTIDFTTGSAQKVAMTGNCTFTLTAPSATSRVQIKLTQDATGSRTAVWPTSSPGKVYWPTATPILTPTANAIDIVTLWYDGTDYFAVATQNFV